MTPVTELNVRAEGSVETEYDATVPPVELTPKTGIDCPRVIDPEDEVSEIAGASMRVLCDVAALYVPIPAALTAASLKLYCESCNKELRVNVVRVEGVCE
jgi:hypothetical protein